MDDKFIYRTDSNGRVVFARGHLDNVDPSWQRNAYQKSGSKRIRLHRQPHDQGGHIFGRQFQGPGEGINIVNMSDKTNGAKGFRKLEDQWAKKISDGKVIDVEYEPTFSPGSTRPDGFRVKWHEDGKPAGSKTFAN